MKEQELARFIYGGYEYHITHIVFQYKEYKISYPAIAVSNKSSKKNRGKSTTKEDAHHKLINHKNPFPLIRKIYKIFEDGLKDCQFVCFSAYEDKTYKREIIYEYYLNKMNYKSVYAWKGYNLLSKNGLELKKKEILKIKLMMYSELTEYYSP